MKVIEVNATKNQGGQMKAKKNSKVEMFRFPNKAARDGFIKEAKPKDYATSEDKKGFYVAVRV